MAGVVKAMDTALKSMNLEKVCVRYVHITLVCFVQNTRFHTLLVFTCMYTCSCV